MITKIVEVLKTGSIPDVVQFGSKSGPSYKRYVVVKPENASGGRRRWRIIVHVQPGENIVAERYIFKEASELLSEYEVTTRSGNTQSLDKGLEYSDVAPPSDDGTISMERIFYSPLILF